MQSFTLYLILIKLSLPCISGLDLSQNRCFLQRSLTLEPHPDKNPILVSKSTGLPATLIRDLELHYQIPEPQGQLLQDEYYCAMLPIVSEYGAPISPPSMTKLKAGLVFVIDIQFIQAPNSEFCLWEV